MRFLKSSRIFPVEVVFSPAWWYMNAGITFDRDFYYHPSRRVEDEKKMEKMLFEKWGRYGLGADRAQDRPEVGPVHLAAGYLVSEMLGCKVVYAQDKPPSVEPMHLENLDTKYFQGAFQSKAFKAFETMCNILKTRYGRLTGDVNWSGILNLALDLRGQDIFVDMFDEPEKVHRFFMEIAGVADKLASWVQQSTGSSSISVNRIVKQFEKPVFLHSECSHTMISVENYEQFLRPFDMGWCNVKRPFGIHYCGIDPHRFAHSFSQIPHLDFLDVGWGGNVKLLRECLPDTFLNIRISPVEIMEMSVIDIHEVVTRLAGESQKPELTGICCINLDDKVTDDKVDALFECAQRIREESLHAG